MLLRSTHLTPEPAPGSPPAPAPPAVPPVSPERRADDFTARMIAEHGTVENALRATAMRLFASQDAATTHERTANELRARLPEGSVVLTKDAAGAWTKLQDLKLTPDQITAAVQERDALKATVTETAAEKQARVVAQAGGLDPDAFAAYALRVKLPTELRDVQTTEHGKLVTKKMPFARNPADDKAAFVALADYVTTLPAHEQRALAATAPAPVTGAPWPAQGPTDPKHTTGDPVAAYMSKRFPPRQPAGAAS